MKTWDLFRIACTNLREKPLRTGLCALSVAVGTAALVLIAAAGLFGQNSVNEGLRTLGVSGLSVYQEGGNGKVLSADAANQIEELVEGVEHVLPIKAQSATMRWGYASERVMLLGVDDRLDDVMQLEVLAGSLLTERDVQFAQPVVVIDDELAQILFGRTNVVGREVKVSVQGSDQTFVVCGVIRAQTSALGGMLSSVAPHLVYLPYSFVGNAQQQTDQVFVQCTAETDPSAVGERITQFLTQRAGLDGNVHVQNMSGMIETVQQLVQLASSLFILVGSITLLVALIGVLCSMLASAYEKTAEVGIFLALGARPCDVKRLFLLQSVLLCAVGGCVGMISASGILLVVGCAFLPPVWLIGGVLLAVVLCGGVAGLLPAHRASRLDPIEAMRN